MHGRAPRTLYATWSNVKAGVSEREFRSWFEDMHRPDSFELGLFDAASRARAASPSAAAYLTLWEGPYPDAESALAKIRTAAGALREQGRIRPVLDVVFQQFLQRVPGHAEPATPGAGSVRALTTLQNDWSRPAADQDFETWWKEAVLRRDAPLDAYHARHAYAAFDLDDSMAGKFLVLLESSLAPEQVARRWQGLGQAALTAFGAPTPVYPEPGAPLHAAGRGDLSPQARRALHVVHWRPESDAVSGP